MVSAKSATVLLPGPFGGWALWRSGGADIRGLSIFVTRMDTLFLFLCGRRLVHTPKEQVEDHEWDNVARAPVDPLLQQVFGQPIMRAFLDTEWIMKGRLEKAN